MKEEKEDYLSYGEKAKKSKDKLLGKRCKNCKKTFKEAGFSAYEGVCKECINQYGSDTSR